MKYYIITFYRKPLVSYKGFHDKFVGHSIIHHWFHYINSAYIVGTTMNADELSNHFIATARAYGLPTTHLVLKVDLKDRQGMLTPDGWNWIRNNATHS